MTAADIARDAWAEQNARVGSLFDILTARLNAGVTTTATAKPSPFPAAVANHPAFTRRFNARLVAVGMAATMDKHRMMR